MKIMAYGGQPGRHEPQPGGVSRVIPSGLPARSIPAGGRRRVGCSCGVRSSRELAVRWPVSISVSFIVGSRTAVSVHSGPLTRQNKFQRTAVDGYEWNSKAREGASPPWVQIHRYRHLPGTTPVTAMLGDHAADGCPKASYRPGGVLHDRAGYWPSGALQRWQRQRPRRQVGMIAVDVCPVGCAHRWRNYCERSVRLVD
jgi:hypothetical protein